MKEICVVCGKEYEKYDKAKKARPTGHILKRGVRTRTCSRICSRIYARNKSNGKINHA